MSRSLRAIDYAVMSYPTWHLKVYPYKEILFSNELELYKHKSEWFLLKAWSGFLTSVFEGIPEEDKPNFNKQLKTMIGPPAFDKTFAEQSHLMQEPSILRALDLQLTDRIDFPDFARA